MEADIRKKLVILLERDFKNERLKNRNAIFNTNIKNPPKNNLPLTSGHDLLEEVEQNVEVVEIFAEDIISDDSDHNPLLFKWEQDDWHQMKLLKQEDISTENVEFEINRNYGKFSKTKHS